MGAEVTLADCKGCPVTNGHEPERVHLAFPHGRGDRVMLSAVLAHLKALRPEWVVTVGGEAPAGARVIDLAWREGRGGHGAFFPTKALRCLTEELQLAPRADLLRWSLEEVPEAGPFQRMVVIHPRGAPWGADQRDLPDDALAALASHLKGRGHQVVVLDRERPDLHRLLASAVLNVCVDSYPQKVALCLPGVPLLCVWRKTHPAHTIDCPEQHPKCLHLVPQNHRQYLAHSAGVDREANVDELFNLFESRFTYSTYTDLAPAVCAAADQLLATPTNGTVLAPVAPRKLLLHSGLCLGDVLTMTAAVEMLHRQHPGRFLTACDTPQCQAVWENNPHVVPATDEFEYIDMQYHIVNESGHRPVHFIGGYAEFLADRLGVPIRMETNRPHLYLSDDEKKWMNQTWETVGKDVPYWVINGGVKSDYPAKQYPFFQRVVDLLAGRVRFVQIGKSSDRHPPLKGTINLIDKTSDRALIRLVYHCQGIVSGVSSLMHLGAAFEKPGVIVAGGREPRLWNSYPTMTLLANVGALDCCKTGGCWRSRVVPENDGKDGETCARPMPTDPPAGQCMTMISPETVAGAVLSYLP